MQQLVVASDLSKHRWQLKTVFLTLSNIRYSFECFFSWVIQLMVVKKKINLEFWSCLSPKKETGFLANYWTTLVVIWLGHSSIPWKVLVFLHSTFLFTVLNKRVPYCYICIFLNPRRLQSATRTSAKLLLVGWRHLDKMKCLFLRTAEIEN